MNNNFNNDTVVIQHNTLLNQLFLINLSLITNEEPKMKISLLVSHFKNGKLIFALFALLILIGISNSIIAQNMGKVTGTITDASSGKVLPGANVIVVGTQIGAATSKDGKYTLSLKPGEYTLKASFVSFKPFKVNVTVVPGKTVLQNFKLKSDLIGTAEVVILGTRRTNRTVIDSPVPVDVLTAKAIERTGATQTTTLLKMLVPSFNQPQNTITDGSDEVRPAAIRGMNPDHVLVLVNGKRRHSSALIHVNGSIGRGSSGVDLNAIPVGAIERIEVLRDGASAQYGSDAIAGVINIILKKKVGFDISATAGENITTQTRGYAENEGNLAGENASTYSWDGNVEDVSITDGFSTDINLGYGIKVNETGTIYLSGVYVNHNGTNRAGLDPRQQYFNLDWATNNVTPDPREKTFNRLNHHWGDSRTVDIGAFLNADIPLKNNLTFYAFGGYTYRTGFAGGFYRRSLDNRNVRAINPDGFLPKISPKIYDGSIVAGLKGSFGKWSYDLAQTYGTNTFNFNTFNTLNASFGTKSKTSFDDGSLKASQAVTTADFLRTYDIGTAEPLNVAVGAEFRWENYQIVAGEPMSYENGGVPILDGPNAGNAAPVGSQVFPGFSPKNEQNQNRTNFGVYVDFENNVLKEWTVSIAGRYENYSDFGSAFAGKLATRYEFVKGFAFRGSISNGFRAPSLSQEYFSSIATNFIGGVPFEVGTFPVNTEVAKALGAKPLEAETSVNTGAGFTFTTSNFDLTVDGYLISLNNRVVLSENFTGSGVRDFLNNLGINATGGRYFTNAVDTKTYGVDITAKYGVQLTPSSNLKFVLAMNFNKTEITNRDEIKTPSEIKAITDIPLMGRVEQGRIEKGQPLSSWNFMANYNYDKFGATFRLLRYGEFSIFNNDPKRDQTYGNVWNADIDLSYSLMQQLTLAVGVNNIFDTYPDKTVKRNSFNGIFPYSGLSPSGFNGRFLYTRLRLSL